MYNVGSRFHTLAIADSPKTRCRIYFITDAVNCWDDNAVQTNGTLLVGTAGDTDSNGRIGQDGVTVTEIFNKDKNLTLGGTVSYQIGMTLVNSDGALNNFAFGRCKVYLDVYDDANSTWLPCPLGVFRIELPVKRKVQLISCSGYDQMQVLNAIADTWWNGLDFTGGLTIANILNSMVTQLGLHLSAASSTNMVNTTLSFTTPPIDSVERTYRDILGWIAEATGTVAHFNRDGELDMRQYLTPQIGGNNIVIDTDTTGNQCLSIDVAEYSVSQIDALTIKLTTSDQGVTVGSGTNVYTIMDNPFLYGPDVATIQGKLTPIYNRLSAYATYSPISTRLIYDWSIEAGDIIYILNNSNTYNMPIFQQKMVWRGGYVTSELISSGDTVRPQVSSGERETYRYNVEMATKVGDNEIISKINQTAESIQIQASRVDLAGYVTFTNLSTSGQTTIDGGNIITGTVTANQIAGGTITSTNLATALNNTINTAYSNASDALSNAATAQSTADSANSQEQLIYISKVSGTTTQSGTTTWVTNATGNQNVWTIKRPTYNSSYPVLFVATQRKSVGGTVTCTTPQIDNTTTVIDGGHITTGTIDAGVVNVTNINASNITSGELSANRISGGTLTVGGLNDQNGQITILNNNGYKIGSINNAGYFLYNPATNATAVQIGRYGNGGSYINVFDDVRLGGVFLGATNTGGGDIYVAGTNGATIFSVNGNTGITTANNTTVNGVLDITPRRCYGSLVDEGWYRVCAISYSSYGEAIGAAGGILRFAITDSYASYPNDVHTIDLLFAHAKVTFVNEASAANGYLEIDKIRYTFTGTSPYNGYVDIHFLGRGGTTYVGISFDYKGIALSRQANVVAQNLQSVVESPNGETELARYTFAANTYYHDDSVTSGVRHAVDRRGDIVTVMIESAGTGGNCPAGQYTTVYTLPSELSPPAAVYTVVDAYGGNNIISGMIDTYGNIRLYPVLSSTSYYRFTLTYTI